MASKKPAKRRSKKARSISGRNGKPQVTRFHGAEEDDFPLDMREISYSGQRYLNPETAEEREKRVAKRKALTLRIFQAAYENHRNKHS